MSCPNENVLVGFIHRGLSPEARAEVELHLRDCETCRMVVASVADQGSGLLAEPTGSGRGEAPAIIQAELAPEERVGRYVVIKRIGSGGMGVVYSAHDPDLARVVALKMLRWEALGATDAREGRARLLREAQTMARLSHPNVVGVYDVGTYGEQVFLAMEYVDGVTLTEWLRSAPPRSAILDAFRQAGLGLAAAHAAGLVHRDFKPGNVLVSADGRVRVTDFGLARTSEEGVDGLAAAPSAASIEATDVTEPHLLTRTGMVLGTPAYMPPEQIVGARPDPSADQFSFCVTLYEALCGKRPFSGTTLLALHKAISAEEVLPPPRSAQMSSSVRRALLRGLKPNPRDRHPSIDALLKALAPTSAPMGSRWAAAALLGLGLVAGLVWAGVQTLTPTPEPVPVPQPPVLMVGPVVDAGPVPAPPTLAEAPVRIPVPAPPPPRSVIRAKAKRASAGAGEGLLAVHVAPWGELTVDERTAESANFMDYVVPLSAGRHVLVITHPTFGKRTQTVVIESGKTLQRTIVLR